MAQIKMKISPKTFNKTYFPYLEDYSHRFNVYYGGAGSGKSVFVVQKLIWKLLKYPNRKLLVIRKVSNTLRDSVFELFKSTLYTWQIADQCKIRDTLLNMDLPNGSTIIFKGIDEPEKIKSITGIDDIFIEECTELTLQDFSQLNLRLRSMNGYNQIHVAFNPISKANWVYKKWFKDEYNHDNTIVLHTTYKDNKFLPKEYTDAMLEYKKSDPTYYKIYALGEFATLDKLIFNNWTSRCFEYQEEMVINKNLTAVFACDFGYVNDPTAFICALIDRIDKKLYIFDEFQEKALTNDAIAKKIITMGYSKEVIVCDSAEPKSIEELRKNGLSRVKGAVKGKDSVLNGIQYLQQYEIIVHPNCTCIIEEFRNYTWMKDKNGIYYNKPIDKYNHGLDALRYAVKNTALPFATFMDIRLLYGRGRQ